MKDYDIAIIQAKRVLKIEENIKACFRLSKCYFEMEDYEEALKYIELADKKNPNDNSIRDLLLKIKSKVSK
jgi:tetratricopeptide (TPR) repeat protein